MPSALLTAASGAPFPLVSGFPYSGQGLVHPQGGVQLKWANNASGNAYVSLSGGGTANSGSFFLSGVTASDGMMMAPGDSYFVPKQGLLFTQSGAIAIWAQCDPAASGQGRLYWETF